MATRRAPSPLIPSGSGGSFKAPQSPGGIQQQRFEDSLDTEVRRVTPSLPAGVQQGGGSRGGSAGGVAATHHQPSSQRPSGSGANVLVVNPSSSRPATGASGVGPQPSSTSFLTADPPGWKSGGSQRQSASGAGGGGGSRPGTGPQSQQQPPPLSPSLPSFGRRSRGGTPTGATGGAAGQPLDASLGLSMDAESAFVMPHHKQGI